MAGQFLTLPDGSLPPGTNAAALEAAGVRLVRPTAPPVPGPGQVVRDTADPTLVGGVWYQRWELVPAPTPVPVRTMTPLEWLRRLPLNRRGAVFAAADNDSMIRGLVEQLRLAVEIDLADAETQQGVAYMVATGVLTQAEANSLLA